MSSRTSFSPFKSAIGIGAVAFAGVMAFMFSFGYFDMSTDNRSQASSRLCQQKGGYVERDARQKATGRCLCANGLPVALDGRQTCLQVSPGFMDPETPKGTPSATKPPVTRPGQPIDPVMR